MTIKRLIILQILLLCGLGIVFILPKGAAFQPAGVVMNLPIMNGDWFGREQEVSQREKDELAKDTEFARKLYTNRAEDQIYASIVLSGEDLDQSIHRPERCLPAQGWTVTDAGSLRVPVEGRPDGLKVTRLHNVRKVQTDNGEIVNIYNLNYYWFIGYQDITESHFERTYIDIRDRILKGQNQRWAYITVAATITGSYHPQGKTEEQTDELIQAFIKDLFPRITKDHLKMPAVLAASN